MDRETWEQHRKHNTLIYHHTRLRWAFLRLVVALGIPKAARELGLRRKRAHRNDEGIEMQIKLYINGDLIDGVTELSEVVDPSVRFSPANPQPAKFMRYETYGGRTGIVRLESIYVEDDSLNLYTSSGPSPEKRARSGRLQVNGVDIAQIPNDYADHLIKLVKDGHYAIVSGISAIADTPAGIGPVKIELHYGARHPKSADVAWQGDLDQAVSAAVEASSNRSVSTLLRQWLKVLEGSST